MKNLILFAILGLGTGSFVAVLSMGVVLIQKGSGVINVALGATAMISGYAFWALKSDQFGFTLGTVPAAAISIAAALVLGLLSEIFAFRPLRASSPIARFVGSLGILLTLQAAMILAFQGSAKPIPQVLPTSAVTVIGVSIPVSQFILAGLAVAAAVVLTLLFRYSQFGLATRAAFENERAAMWIGLNPNRIAIVNTLIASTLVGGMAILSSSALTVDPLNMPLLIIPALAAALFARFDSIPRACAVGLAIGAGINILYYLTTLSWFPKSGLAAPPGIQQLLVFIIMTIAVWTMGSKLPQRGEFVERPLPAVREPRNISRLLVWSIVVGTIAMIVFPFDFRQALMLGITGGVLAVSVVVITGYVGQVSIMQLALSGVTGFTMSHVQMGWGVGFVVSALCGILAAVLVGVLVGVTALRVRGIQLAVLSLAATDALDHFWFSNPKLGGSEAGTPIEEPHLFGLDIGGQAAFRGIDGKIPSPVLGILMLVVAALLMAYVAHLRRTKLGQQMVVVRSNERAAASVGINIRNTKILAFTISSALAGVAGVMYALNYSSVSEQSFNILLGLQIIGLCYMTGITMTSGGALAGMLTVGALVPYAFEKWFGLSGTWAVLLAGLGLIYNTVYLPEGGVGQLRAKADARREERRRAQRPAPLSTGVLSGGGDAP